MSCDGILIADEISHLKIVKRRQEVVRGRIRSSRGVDILNYVFLLGVCARVCVCVKERETERDSNRTI